MELKDLLVINLRKDRSALEPQSLTWLEGVLSESFELHTCLRRVWVMRRSSVLEKVLISSAYRDNLEMHVGKAGYGFLLSVASGLESAIPGETDVFGQLKEAWKKFDTTVSDSLSELRRELRPWIQKLFEDVKEIRSRYLQGMGGSSYGSVTRMLLGQERQGPLLLLGAGQMARSVVPYLLSSELWVWNRSLERLGALIEKIRMQVPGQSVKVLGSTERDELHGWSEAKDVVICIPSDSKMDEERVRVWNSRPDHSGCVLHLGILKAAGTPWEKVKNIKTLSDLFDIQKNQSEARKSQIEQARACCREKANLRGLGGSSSLAHGWEDLAIFNSVLVE